ncbi:PIN domain-containing protein [Mobiluncus mulieris]|uniref:PIN domain-containing protein n=1 Tax=Mobiluncus mulieris TaxID=2052 RepID=A0A7Y0U2V0_9ACTO|nr:PIN domain-containing protein [Mobiluncus mulieris]
MSPPFQTQVESWQADLAGTTSIISFQTRAEVLQGAYAAHWGESRLATLRQILDSTPTIPANTEVIEAMARLFTATRAAGNPIQDKNHTADRWIAASAIAYDLPLFSTDHIFCDVPGLRLLADS